MSRLFLGLDSSTQSLSGVLIDADAGEIVTELSVSFDQDLPQYDTRNGTIPGDGVTVHSQPELWLDALDLLLGRLRDSEADLSSVCGISGSGQQHGSVYLNEQGLGRLGFLDASHSLAENLRNGFSRATSPIWMDASTSEECHEITEALGGPSDVARLTGSTAFERFAGPQIRKFYKNDPEAYRVTARIHLVSSFMASVLSGRDAAVDPGDGAGMNLMDIREKTWLDAALDATAPDLSGKLPQIRESSSISGPISPYFVQKYGFSPTCRCLVWSGDNPCSVIGLGLIKTGMTAISLGTSDTFMGLMTEPRVSEQGEGHVFGAPTGDYMTLICFRNGSLAREHVREACGYSWEAFSQALEQTLPGNGGGMMLPWVESEITPHVPTAGLRRKNLDEQDGPANCRAVIEGQMMAMKLHTAWACESPGSIYVTGGASVNRSILQVMADIFDCTVYPFRTTNGAALGAALRAYQGVESMTRGQTWRDIVQPFAVPDHQQAVRPIRAHRTIYTEHLKAFEAYEQEELQTGDSAA